MGLSLYADQLGSVRERFCRRIPGPPAVALNPPAGEAYSWHLVSGKIFDAARFGARRPRWL